MSKVVEGSCIFATEPCYRTGPFVKKTLKFTGSHGHCQVPTFVVTVLTYAVVQNELALLTDVHSITLQWLC